MIYFFLYTELAEYTMQCFRIHLERNPEDEIHVIHYPVNAEAPFRFAVPERLFLYPKPEMQDDSLHQLADRLNPSVLICSGWADREYNEIASGLSGKGIPVVLCFDNLYSGTLKQRIFLPLARLIFRRRYKACWVPGKGQSRFAIKLGFGQEDIYTGFYATDTSMYNGYYEENVSVKKDNFPRRFLCVARYVPQKGLEYLWHAFIAFAEKDKNDWELWCAGTGDGFNFRIEHPRIKHLGFVQPQEFKNLIKDCGIFILPSLSEPWGVAVNEFATAGMPVLLSNRVGSGESFLSDGENGFSFKPGNVKSIFNQLTKIANLDKDTLLKMGEVSHKLGSSVSAVTWSETLSQLGNKYSDSTAGL